LCRAQDAELKANTLGLLLLQVGVKCVVLKGSMSMEQRDRMISAFTEDPDVTVFLMSLKAGGPHLTFGHPLLHPLIALCGTLRAILFAEPMSKTCKPGQWIVRTPVLASAGVALNLTAASHVFLIDIWWNPACEVRWAMILA